MPYRQVRAIRHANFHQVRLHKQKIHTYTLQNHSRWREQQELHLYYHKHNIRGKGRIRGMRCTLHGTRDESGHIQLSYNLERSSSIVPTTLTLTGHIVGKNWKSPRVGEPFRATGPQYCAQCELYLVESQPIGQAWFGRYDVPAVQFCGSMLTVQPNKAGLAQGRVPVSVENRSFQVQVFAALYSS